MSLAQGTNSLKLEILRNLKKSASFSTLFYSFLLLSTPRGFGGVWGGKAETGEKDTDTGTNRSGSLIRELCRLRFIGNKTRFRYHW